MKRDILRPVSDDELKQRVEEFANRFVELNRRNKVSLDELKCHYGQIDSMLYQVLRGSNGIVDGVRLIDMVYTLLINYFLENRAVDHDSQTMREPDKRFIYFLILLLQKYTQSSDASKSKDWVDNVIDEALRRTKSKSFFIF
jgi:hypothetical protein